MEYLIAKWLHVLSSTVLFGTGIGSAYYMLVASRHGDPHTVAFVARQVVIADWLFTTPTVLLQPATGAWLIHLAHWPLAGGWLFRSILLYAFAVACWLPVVLIQIRMRDLALHAVATGTALPPAYRFWLRLWTALGFLALFAFLAVFWLMVGKPGNG